eukprot:TRINITY_DN9516_c0_g1_i6.p1 TRINITY_DN9516_c0_g1~~TRINITY_DN9516_c0_g1_i6.p1  ORF type:complete len:432 (+),score=83.08 TRINITY_DN9516_c0_g1_i6:95-1390(+)
MEFLEGIKPELSPANRPLPPNVQKRETELLNRIQKSKGLLPSGQLSSNKMIQELDEISREIQENDRATFIEYLGASSKSRKLAREEAEKITQEKERQFNMSKKEYCDEIETLKKERDTLQLQVNTLEDRWLYYLRVFHCLAYRDPYKNNPYRKLMDDCNVENSKFNLVPMDIDPIKVLLEGEFTLVKVEEEPLGEEEWRHSFDQQGRVINPTEIKRRVFSGGVSESVRPELWKFLLGYFPWDSTVAEREELIKTKNTLYQQLKDHWVQIKKIPEHFLNFDEWVQRLDQIEKDVIRTDRDEPPYKKLDSVHLSQLRSVLSTYAWYNWSIGYVQGMNDVLSPIVPLMNNEVDSFWCFVGLMKIMSDLFRPNQPGVIKKLCTLTENLSIVDPEAVVSTQSTGDNRRMFLLLLAFVSVAFSQDPVYLLCCNKTKT